MMKWSAVASLFVVFASGSAEANQASLCSHARSAASMFRAVSAKPALSAELLQETDVLKYALEIEAKPTTKELIGTNTMSIKSLKSNLSEFTFRLSNAYTITVCQFNGRTVPFVRLDSATVRATFDQPVAQGEEFTLKIGYQGIAPTNSGFGSIKFGTRNSGAAYVETLSEPFYAYTWWPGKDDNDDKALVDFNVIVPSTMVAASNGLLVGTDTLTGSRKRYRWSSRYPIATYLVSFGASNYTTWSQTFTYPGGTMPVQFFIWPEYNNSSNRTGWERCVPMLGTFGQKFGTYPFIEEKYGIYQFTFGGGMEHQTITGQSGFTESLTAHELAHQWWGDMVTCRNWEDIWLNEGFATYSEALWLEFKSGSTGLAALKTAMQNRKPSSSAGTVYCYNALDINAIFNYDTSYLKGGWVLHQLRHVMGDQKFFDLLLEYRRRHEFKSAETSDFQLVAEELYGAPLDWFFSQWVYQGGAPNYTVGTQNLTVNGRKYVQVVLNQTQTASYPTFRMPLDFDMTQATTSRHVLWNHARQQHYLLPVSTFPTSTSLDPDQWVLTGSKGTTNFVAGPPKIIDITPKLGTSRIATDTVKIVFHTPVTATSEDFQVLDPQGRPLRHRYRYDPATNTATLQLGRAAIASGSIVRVMDSVKAVNSGKALDGEGRSFPSGDGVPGGAAEYRY